MEADPNLVQDPLIIWFMEHPWAFWLMLLWVFSWKGVALWRAAKNNHLKWFIAILVVNTLGLVEIVYILFFGKKKEAKE